MTDYREIYLHNIYEVVLSRTSTFSFSLQKLHYHNIFDRPFGIITASNPNNILLSDDENSQRNQQLYKDLNAYETLEAQGCYKGHCEKGYLVFEIGLDTALVLGRRYDQYAVFYSDGDCLKYMECATKKVIIKKKIDPKGSKA